jgi:hypothetical protein
MRLESNDQARAFLSLMPLLEPLVLVQVQVSKAGP